MDCERNRHAVIKIKTKGMHCKSCEMIISDALENVIGVVKSVPNAKTNIVEVTFNDNEVTPEKIVDIIRKEGFK